jgi:hypothetical protein
MATRTAAAETVLGCSPLAVASIDTSGPVRLGAVASRSVGHSAAVVLTLRSSVFFG